GQTLGCNPGVNPCLTTVREPGTMEVTAVVNGLEQVDSVATVDPKVKITPSQGRMRPTIVLDAPAYQPRHDTVKQSITIAVVDEHGTQLKNRTVDLTVKAKENT